MAGRRPKANKGVSTRTVRFSLFLIWSVLTVAYVLFFFVLGALERADQQEAREVAVRTIFIHLPVLAAFGSFWFSIDSRTNNSEAFKPYMDKHEVWAIVVLTAIVHTISIGYLFLFLVVAPPGGELGFPEEYGKSFRGVANFGIDLLVILSGLAFLPVEYLTRRKVEIQDAKE